MQLLLRLSQRHDDVTTNIHARFECFLKCRIARLPFCVGVGLAFRSVCLILFFQRGIASDAAMILARPHQRLLRRSCTSGIHKGSKAHP